MSDVADKILRPEVLIHAYSTGFFPFPHPQTGEIIWLRPDPRAVIPLEGFRVSRSLRRSISKFEVTFDQNFAETMESCSNRDETWITAEFKSAYGRLYQMGIAHSVEVRRDGNIVGGVYGLALGGAFFAESKFHRERDASKVALYHLVEHLKQKNFILLEVQFQTAHLSSLGAVEIPDEQYIERLNRALAQKVAF